MNHHFYTAGLYYLCRSKHLMERKQNNELFLKQQIKPFSYFLDQIYIHSCEELSRSYFFSILFTLWESRGYPYLRLLYSQEHAKGSQYMITASPLEALDLEHPRLSLHQGKTTKTQPPPHMDGEGVGTNFP
jgi:hypothetical protein